MSEKLTPPAMREMVDDLAEKIATLVTKSLTETLTTTNARKRTRREIAGELIESLGADALVVLWSRHRAGKTVASKFASGNSLACKGLVDWAWDAQQDSDGEVSEDE